MFVGAFTSGLGDSINPCNFAMLLIFVTILSRVAYGPKEVFLYGCLFICISGGIQYFSVQGFFDQLLTLNIVLEIIRYSYLLIAAALLFLGAMHILDWKNYKKHNNIECFKLQSPVFFQDKFNDRPLDLKERSLAIVQNTGVIVFAASVLSFMGAVYPQSEYVYILHSFLMSGQNSVLAHQSLGFYSFAMVVPLIIIWFLICFIVFSGKRSVKIVSYYKGVSAALFIATGFGLGHFFLN